METISKAIKMCVYRCIRPIGQSQLRVGARIIFRLNSHSSLNSAKMQYKTYTKGLLLLVGKCEGDDQREKQEFDGKHRGNLCIVCCWSAINFFERE